MPKVTLINNHNGDWVAVYVDGVCRQEGHTIQLPILLEDLGYEIEHKYVDDEYFLQGTPSFLDG